MRGEKKRGEGRDERRGEEGEERRWDAGMDMEVEMLVTEGQ